MVDLSLPKKRMPGIAERHADEVDFLWSMRDNVARSAAHDLSSLGRWDERLDAHLDGLRIAGDIAWDVVLRQLQAKAEKGKPLQATFGAAWLAVEQGDFERFAAVLDLAVGGRGNGVRAVIAALAFVSYERAERFMRPLVTARAAILQRIGIAAAAAHGRDLGADFAQALGATDPALRARAAKAVGELGRRDLVRALEFMFDDPDPACRFAAVWSATVLGDASAAQMVWSFCQADAPFVEDACCLAALADPMGAPAKLRDFAARSGDLRSAFVGAAALGDSVLIPWLFEQMRTPDHARIAANAFVCITGVDMVANRLTAKPPEGFRGGPNDDPNDHDVAMDPDHGLPWPDTNALQTWWSGVRKDFPAGTRFWLGRSIAADGVDHALRAGNQKLRSAAAWAYARRAPGRVLFAVRAPAARQSALLGRL